MSITLTNLPPELLTRIIANVKSQHTLYNLALSSRQLYSYSIPYLYQHITIQEEKQQSGQLRNLTSLLIQRPDLAKLVQYFALHTAPFVHACKYSEDPKYSGDFEYFKESDGHASARIGKGAQAFKTAVSAWNLSKEEQIDWLEQLTCPRSWCHHDSVLALLLPALPKVKNVVLDLKFGHETHRLERMIQRSVRKKKPFNIQQPFEALTVFACPHSQPGQQIHTIHFLALLLKLPAIQEISGCFNSQLGEFFSHVRFPPRDPVKIDSSSSSVTSLDLAAYALSEADFIQVLQAPKALRTLFYTVDPPNGLKSEYIHHALGTQKDILESFSLDYDNSFEELFVRETMSSLGELDYFRVIKSFTSFNALRVLKIAVLFFFTSTNWANCHKLINIFPPSLEVLHLTRFQGRFECLLEAVDHLLASKSSQHISSLKRVILEESLMDCARKAKLMDVMWKDTPNTAMERLSRVATAQGVSFDVIVAPGGEEPFEEDSEVDE